MWSGILRFLYFVVFGTKKVQKEAAGYETPTADTTTKVITPVVKEVQNNNPAPGRPYRVPPMLELLKLIRLHESGKAGYNADYQNDDRWELTNKTFDQVRRLSRLQVEQGEASSAIGAYQFLTKTMDSLKLSLNLTGNEIMGILFQDDLGVALMIRRGLMRYLRGEISPETFSNNLAMEWASLPVVTRMKGSSRTVSPGQSYYAGDGLNRAFHKPAVVLAAVKKLRDYGPVILGKG